MPDSKRGGYGYWAFISYSSKDQSWARWLHGKLEGYKIPARLVGRENASGEAVPKRLKPIFRDRDELPASADLGEQLERALTQSRYLIVICSPNSAHSQWVDKEIESFIRQGREHHLLALIVDGEPNAGGELECFPPHLRSVEPIAADARKGADGKRNAMLKLVAGMLGVGFDDLRQRDAIRRARRMRIALVSALLLAAVFAGLGLYAYLKRIEADAARAVAIQQETESKRRLALSYVDKAWSRFDDGNNADALLWHVEALRTLTSSPIPLGSATEQNYRTRIARIAAHAAPPPRLILAPDGEPRGALVSVAGDRILVGGPGWVQLYAYRGGEAIGEQIVLDAGEAAGFSADETLLLGSSGRAWRLEDGSPVDAGLPGSRVPAELPGNARLGSSIRRAGEATTIRAPDGSFVVRRNKMTLEIEYATGQVDIIDTEKGRPPDSMMGFLQRTYLALSPDQRFLVASFAASHRFFGGQVWDLRAMAKVGEFLHPKGFTAIGFSPDSRQFASAGDDATVRLWSLSAVDEGRMQEIAAPLRHGDRLVAVAFVDDGTALLTVAADRTVRIWPVMPYATLFHAPPPVETGAGGGTRLDGIPLLEIATDSTLLQALRDVTGDRSFAFAVVSPEGDKAVFSRQFGFAASPDTPSNKAQVWRIDANTSTPKAMLYEIEHPDSISAVAFDNNGQWLATGSSNGEARVWDAATGEALSPILPAPQEVTALVPVPAQKRLVVASSDKRVRVWDIDDGQMVVPPLAFEAHLKKLTVTQDLIQVESEYLGPEGTIDYLALGPDRPVNRPTRDDWQRGPAPETSRFGQAQTVAWRLAPTRAEIADLVARSKLVGSQAVDELGSEDTLSAEDLSALNEIHRAR